MKPGKGGAFVRTKLKNVRTGRVSDNTFRAGEKIEIARLDSKEMQYLYHDGLNYIFMDIVTYEQFPLPYEIFKDSLRFIKENTMVKVLFHGDIAIDVEIPIFVELEVISTDPGFKGDTATSGYKPATLETGYTLQVPLFINTNDKVRVDTRTGNYCERVK